MMARIASLEEETNRVTIGLNTPRATQESTSPRASPTAAGSASAQPTPDDTSHTQDEDTSQASESGYSFTPARRTSRGDWAYTS